jgi:hypothetical protein
MQPEADKAAGASRLAVVAELQRDAEVLGLQQLHHALSSSRDARKCNWSAWMAA